MSSPIIQVDCASCGTNYRLALPKVLVDRPQKSMSFRCNHCSYKFQIQPKDILEQEAVASTLILVESNGFHVHHNLESVADLVANGTYGAEDTIRVFGQAWSMIGDEPSLAGLFTDEGDTGSEQDTREQSDQDNGDNQDSSLLGDLSTDVTFDEEVAEVEDVPLDFDEVEDSVGSDREMSEQEMSEIDPFSEGYSSGDEDHVFPDAIEDSFAADFFADATQEPVNTIEDDSDDFIIEDVPLDDSLSEDGFDGLTEEHTVEATADVDQAIVNEFTEDVTRASVAPPDAPENGEIPEEPQLDSADLVAFDEDFEDIADEFAAEAIAANLWEELDVSEDDIEVTPEQIVSQPTQNQTPEQDLQSTKNALLTGTDVSTSVFQEPKVARVTSSTSLEDEALVPQMEIEDNNNSRVPKPTTQTDSPESPKPKQRLSFSNKVPEVKKVKKREINGLHAFAIIVLFCIVVIAGTWWKSNKDKQEFAGLETNSNILRPMNEEKKGLRESDKEDGQAPVTDTIQDGEAPSSLEQEAQTDEVSEAISSEDFQDPYPQVLPDVPEESIDFANDKTPTELTREGFQALEKESDPDKAIKLFERALEKDNDFANAILGLAKAYHKRGEFDQAKEVFCRHVNLPRESFSTDTTDTIVEPVNHSLGILSQLGLSCDDA